MLCSERGHKDGPQLDPLSELGTMLSRDAKKGLQKVQLIQGTGQEDLTGHSHDEGARTGSLDVEVPCVTR